MTSPLVSIIIPTYNRAHLIGETLDSVLAQTYSHWECIVVDDGSTDGTAALLDTYCAKDPRIQYYHRPKNRPKGANACRNYGFEVSNGEYVNWLDSDNLIHKDKIITQLNVLLQSGYNFSVCQSLIFKKVKRNSLGLRSEQIYSSNVFSDFLKKKISFLTEAPIWKADFLKTFSNLFDESLQAAQEWEFFCRILYVSPEFHFTNEPYVYIREHEDSISYKKDFQQVRNFNYLKARVKIYKLIKSSSLDEDKRFLTTFIYGFYKNYLVTQKLTYAKFILFKFILKTKNLSFINKLKSVMAYLSYVLFNRGYFLIKSVNAK